MTAILDAHKAIVAALADVIDDVTAQRDADLPGDQVERFLNVVLPPNSTQVTAEQLGMGEDDVITEFVQTFHVEWIVREEGEDVRDTAFSDGQMAISAALLADRRLGGKARGLTIGVPNFASHTYAGAEHTCAVVIPVRVELRAVGSPIS